MMKQQEKKVRVIPGFSLTLGITVTMLSLIVLIPLASVLVYSLKLSPKELLDLLLTKNVRNAFLTSISCSFLAACINTVFGLILAWVLVKYDFFGKRFMDGLFLRRTAQKLHCAPSPQRVFSLCGPVTLYSIRPRV